MATSAFYKICFTTETGSGAIIAIGTQEAADVWARTQNFFEGEWVTEREVLKIGTDTYQGNLEVKNLTNY